MCENAALSCGVFGVASFINTFWSEWGDSNARSLEPKSSAIPTSLHPDIQFLPLYHGERENQSFFCLWSFMWSKPLLYRFRQSVEIPQMQVSQGFAAFCLALSRILPRHSQIGTERFFELFPLNFGSFRSVPIAFCHSLNVLFPYTPHHTVAEAVVKNLAK